MTDTSLDRIGSLIRDARKHRGLTQTQLASVLGTSQSAVHRIEAGNQNVSLEMVNRIAAALDSPLISVGPTGPVHLRVRGGAKLNGSIEVRSSKNAAVALLCASLLNRGRTVIRGIARIEEVNRILEVLVSIGVQANWLNGGADLELVRPHELNLEGMNLEAARRTRSVIMFLGPLLHSYDNFELPYAGGCDLGARTIEPHLQVLRRFGLDVTATDGFYLCKVDPAVEPERPIILTERGDTVTENALLAAALSPGRDRAAQRQPELHGPGPLRLPHPAGRGDRRHRHHHPADPRRPADQHRRGVRPVGGPDRGDEPDHRGDRDRVGGRDPAGADRVPGDRAGDPGGDGSRLHPR